MPRGHLDTFIDGDFFNNLQNVQFLQCPAATETGCLDHSKSRCLSGVTQPSAAPHRDEELCTLVTRDQRAGVSRLISIEPRAASLMGQPAAFVLVHLGAGFHSANRVDAYKELCTRCCEDTAHVLNRDGDLAKALVHGITMLEVRFRYIVASRLTVARTAASSTLEKGQTRMQPRVSKQTHQSCWSSLCRWDVSERFHRQRIQLL